VRLDARFRWLFACASALGLALVSDPAVAQEPAAPSPSQAATNSETIEDTSYRGTVALLYGIGYAGTFAGYYMTRQEPNPRPYGVRIVGSIVLPSGVLTTLFGPMLVHFDHGSLGKGLLSAGGQVVAIVAGAAAGYGVASIAGTEETGTAMLIGGLSFHAGWALFDTLSLARDEQVVDRTIPAPTYALSLAPLPGGGVQAGAAFRF
jgi:hypothetical protein